jgi:acetylornithine/N-succinyldiaminopimelate aminotransferase
MSQTQSELVDLGHSYLYQNYRQPPMVLVKGQGSVVWDKSGKRYLDLAAGIAVNSLGHAHPAIVAAISEQAATLSHVSNYFFNEPNLLLAERLCKTTGLARAFFCNSGTEAIEASLKLVRRHFFNQGQTDRHRVIAFKQSFHGRTMGALAATGQAAYRDGFGPLGNVTHVEFGKAEQVAAAMGPDVAAILVEPVQGEGGVLVAPDGFLAALRQIANQHGAFLVFDEIQTGVGRTGTFLAAERWGVKPDVVALAKGLGAGFPIGAMLCVEALADALPPGSHGTTFGGNPLASRVALTVLEVIEREQLLRKVNERGQTLRKLLEQLLASCPKQVSAIRGLGLLQAFELAADLDAREVVAHLRDRGVLVTIAGGKALRISPPLVISDQELEEAFAIITDVVSRAQPSASPVTQAVPAQVNPGSKGAVGKHP